MSNFVNLPPQQLPFSKKTKKWRKQIVDWAESKSFSNYSPVRNSIIHKKINYDLLNGKLHMQDLEIVINPENQTAGFIPDKIQHYPIMNSKLNVLRGEEYKRVFDFKVIITNPNSIAEIENTKKEELLQRLQQIISNTAQSEEEFNQELEKLNDFYTYEWQDLREVRANAFINHYMKEYNMPLLFNNGFMDALAVGEEIYQCDIVGGEPTIERINPLKIRVFKSGYSNRIEDADIIVLEDYWSPGKIIDTYYDVLTKKDIEESLKKYTVIFNSNGGTNVDNQIVIENHTVTKPGNPTKTGYIFVEWQLDGKAYSFGTKVTKDITLKAVWEEEKTHVTVIFDVVGGSLIDNQKRS